MPNRPGHRMRRDIMEQPDAINTTLAAETDSIVEFTNFLKQQDIRNVMLVARGTSDNAGMYARYALSILANKQTSLTATSLLTVYDVDLDFRNTMVMGISQSGESQGAIEFLETANKKGAITCALTNSRKSPLAQVAQHVLCTHAKSEQSLPPTKTYTTALAVIHQLAALWGSDQVRAKQIYDVPMWISQVLAREGEIINRAERYRYMNTCNVMARGFSLCTALEVSLKLAQCTYVVPAPYSGAEFLHGPIASTETGFPCFLFAPKGKSLQSMSELLDTLNERGAETFAFSNSGPLLDRAKIGIQLPDLPEELAPMVSIVAGQLFAMHLALHKGIDPDQPRGLTKVTLTL